MAADLINGEIPAHWEFTTLGDVCQRGGGNIQTGPFGSQLHAADYVAVGIPSIMPTNIGENRIVENGIVRITEQDANRLSQHRLRAGDIVYSRRGDVEKRALIRVREEGWLCGTGCLKVRLGSGVVDPLFASLFLGHPSIREWIVRHAVGATMPNLNTSIMSAVPFALPPLAEQKAIAAVLGALDDKIELNRRMNATLEAMARALFQSWFVDFDPVRAKLDGRPPAGLDPATAALFPSAFQDSNLGPIPQGWEVGRLDDVLILQRGFDLPTPDRTHGKYPVMAASGPNGCHDKFMVRGPGVTTGRSGVLGKVFFIHGDFWPLNTSLWVRDFKRVSPAYAFHLLRGLDFEVFNAGSAVPTLNRNHVHNLQVVIPAKPIIQAFDAQIMPLMKLQKANEEQSMTLSTLRDTLLPKLLSGEIQVNDVY
jgi:type I restriction enzyme S subunit